MIRTAVNLSKSATSLSRIIRSRGSTRNGPCFYGPPRPPLRPVHDDAGISGPNSNPVTVQMINYALSHARSQKSGHFSFFLYFFSVLFWMNFLVFELQLDSFWTRTWFINNDKCIYMCRGIICSRFANTGAVPLYSAKRRPMCSKLERNYATCYVYLIIWKVLFFIFILLFIYVFYHSMLENFKFLTVWFSFRGNLTEAIEKLQGAESLKQSSLGVRGECFFL